MKRNHLLLIYLLLYIMYTEGRVVIEIVLFTRVLFVNYKQLSPFFLNDCMVHIISKLFYMCKDVQVGGGGGVKWWLPPLKKMLPPKIKSLDAPVHVPLIYGRVYFVKDPAYTTVQKLELAKLLRMCKNLSWQKSQEWREQP